jgi:uncharacterized membrane protein YcaP (DUF421 family)
MHFLELLDSWIGLNVEPRDLTFVQVTIRGVIVFIAALAMVRLGDKRVLSKKTAFDAVLGLILASMLARAINGSAPFWSTLAVGFVLVGLHRLMAMTARRWHGFGNLVKGRSELVIHEGRVLESGLRKNDISEHDLAEDLRLNGKVERPDQVKVAYVERNGDISVIPRKD